MGTKARQPQSTKPAAHRAATVNATKRAKSTNAKTVATKAVPKRGKDAPETMRTPKGTLPPFSDIAHRATIRQARERLDRISEIRDASQLAAAGLGQREIAESLRTTQPRIHRLLKAAQVIDVTRESPEELILRATVENTDRQVLVKSLTDALYTFRKHAPEPFDGAVSGTWDQVRAAAIAGLLTRHEYELVRDAVNPPS